eukprot:SAG31_NODE_35707_length_320_cov_1.194570_1_plen_31_part_10
MKVDQNLTAVYALVYDKRPRPAVGQFEWLVD